MGTKNAIKNALLGVLLRPHFVARLSPRERAVALTFDDGPVPEHTPRILDILREHGRPGDLLPDGDARA